MLGALYLSVTKWPFPKSQVTHLDQRPVSDRRVAGSGQYRIDQSAHLRPLSPLANPGWMQVCTAVSLARVRDDFWTRFLSRFCKIFRKGLQSTRIGRQNVPTGPHPEVLGHQAEVYPVQTPRGCVPFIKRDTKISPSETRHRYPASAGSSVGNAGLSTALTSLESQNDTPKMALEDRGPE